LGYRSKCLLYFTKGNAQGGGYFFPRGESLTPGSLHNPWQTLSPSPVGAVLLQDHSALHLFVFPMSVSHITLEEQGGIGELTGLLKSLTVIINILLLNAT